MSAGRRLCLLVLLAVAAAGALAAAGQLAHGLESTAKNRPVMWGAYVSNLLFFSAAGHGAAWIAAWAALARRGDLARAVLLPAAGLAFLAGAVAGLNPLLHLGRPHRFYFTMTSPQPRSALFWDMVGVQAFAAAAGGLLALVVLARRWPRLAALLGPAGVTAALVAVLAHVAGARILSATSVPMWGSPLHLPASLAAGLVAGLAAVGLALAASPDGRAQAPALARALVAAAAVAFALGAAEHLRAGLSSDAAEGAVLWSKLLGPYAARFWTMAALTLPLPLLLLGRARDRSARSVASAALALLAGLWLERYLGIVAPLSHPRIGSAAGAYAMTRGELAVVLGEFAAVGLGWLAVERLAPRRLDAA